MSMYTHKQFISHVAWVVLLCATLTGCAIKYEPKPYAPPAIVHCIDTVGHSDGAQPFIYGGTCCCTPTKEVLADYKESGAVSEDFTVEDMFKEYEHRGIVTARDFTLTNNLDHAGPHIVFGGNSMIPPTPGTHNYEAVLFGKQDEWKIKKKVLRRKNYVKKT